MSALGDAPAFKTKMAALGAQRQRESRVGLVALLVALAMFCVLLWRQDRRDVERLRLTIQQDSAALAQYKLMQRETKLSIDAICARLPHGCP